VYPGKTADLSTALRSGRDDKGEGRYGPQQRSRDGQIAAAERKLFLVQQLLSLGSTALPFVISTEAYPDFLLRSAGHDHVCGSP
jgi:hypothetical protein